MVVGSPTVVAEMNDEDLIAYLVKMMDETQPYVTRYSTYQRRGKHWEDPEHPICKPYLVTIGPDNQAGTNSAYMDNMKWRCLKYLVKDKIKELQNLLKNLAEMNANARGFYGEDKASEEVKTRMKGKNLTIILILDGFFIICYAAHFMLDQQEGNPFSGNEVEWTKEWIKHDLLLIDYQIPFEIIKIIWGWLTPVRPYQNLIEVLYDCFMAGYGPMSSLKKKTAVSKSFHHILHLYHHFIELENGENDIVNSNYIQPNPNATELHMKECVKFRLRKQEECSSPFDINFDKKTGILEIPLIQMSASWKAILQSLIYLEEPIEIIETHVIAYVYFMFCLLKNTEDVKVLSREGIIQNNIGTEDDATKFFMDLWRRSNGFITQFPKKYVIAKDDVAIMDDKELILYLEKKMNASHQPGALSYKPYQRRRNDNHDLEQPDSKPYLVSIGPYNHASSDLIGVENMSSNSAYMINMKWRCLKFLASNKIQNIQCLLDKLRENDEKARRFYEEAKASEEVETRMRKNNLTKILILDGFFIICYVLSVKEQENDNPFCDREIQWMKDSIMCDLLLIDNQIPFEIIKIIWGWLTPVRSYQNLIEVMYDSFMVGYAPEDKKTPPESKTFHHILHLYHHFIELKDEQNYIQNGNYIQPTPSATSLKNREGVMFKLGKEGECSSFFDVKFEKKTSILQIPLIQMTASWKAVLQSLINFEESIEIKTHVIAYVYLMFCLLKNNKDVQILNRARIIQNKIGTEDDAAKFFADLWRGSKHVITHFPCKYVIDKDNVTLMNDEQLISYLKKKMESLSDVDASSYRTYQKRRNDRNDPEKSSSNPYLVSIGPYNDRKSSNLRHLLEKMKWACLKYLAKDRITTDFQGLLNDLNKIDSEARQFYGEVSEEVKMRMRGKNFTKILILDGFFIICYVLSNKSDGNPLQGNPLSNNNIEWMEDWINQDLLLIDNQIPFDVIKKIWEWLKRSNEGNRMHNLNLKLDRPLIKHILNCFIVSCTIKDDSISEADLKSFHHILHLYHHFIGVKGNAINQNDIAIDIISREDLPSIPSATELEKAGMQFKLLNKEDCSSPLDVKFDKKNGMLEIPSIEMTVSWKVVLQNVMDFEEFTNSAEMHAVAYVYLMFCLLKNNKDVKILSRARIIKNKIGTEDDAAKFFIDLWRKSNGVGTHFQCKYLFQNINIYSHSILNVWKASLITAFWENPLITFSLILFIFQSVQVIYDILSYHNGR